MKTIALCLISAVALIFGFWSRSESQEQQAEAKAEIKKKKRNARYHSDIENVANLRDGERRVSFVDFVDTTGYDPKMSAQEKEKIRNRLEKEHKEKRKSVACDATVILYGTIKDPRGYVTEDNTAIYTIYKLAITEVIRAPQSLVFSAGAEIEVTVPGGTAKTADGRRITVEDPTYTPLLPTRPHILLLKYDEEADDYYVFDPLGVYKIMKDGTMIRGDAKHAQLVKEAYLAKEPNTVEAVLSELKSLDCKK